MAHARLPLVQQRFGETMRRDAWWVQPALVFLVLSAFVVYSTWAAFQGAHYRYGHYLSPFYSPELFGDSPHALVRAQAGVVARWLPFSPACFPGRLPAHLLLLPRRLLQGVLGRPARLRRGRAAQAATCGEAAFPLILQNIHRYFLYLALLFLVVLAHDVWQALWFTDPATGRAVLRHRRRHARARRQRRCCSSCYTLGCHSLRHLVGGYLDQLSRAPIRKQGLRLRELPQPRHMRWAWMQPVLGGVRRPLRPPVLDGHLAPTGGFCDLAGMADYQRFEHDVLVIGAGGAGLRAAIEAAAAGVSVGLVCKSLLGKAHTVMAEGGVAAALANVDDRDNWQVHFADTMRGGQYLNNWRMAELHAKEAPDRVRELEAWGARVRPHQGRPHPAAQLRRPPLPPPGPRRRPHRPGDDPHPAGPRHPPGHRGPHGVHRVSGCSRTATASRAPSATTASAAASCSSRPRPSCSPPAASAEPTRSPATAGSTPATATRWPTTPAPS